MERRKIIVAGIVQGVGFRPFVYNLAERMGLTGKVLNEADQVVIEVQGQAEFLADFVSLLRSEQPPAARVQQITIEALSLVEEERDFQIELSASGVSQSARISPDLAVCHDCLAELKNPADRRNGYAFINCTNCGPRFSIIEGYPYDRVQTTMKNFALCDDCKAEYKDPHNRRFHAQPNACPICGPHYELLDQTGKAVAVTDPIERACLAIKSGKIVAAMGIGGIHLVCNAWQEEAVAKLRQRKGRPHKPLAVMAGSLALVKKLCFVSEEEEKQLLSLARPIVLLKRKTEVPLPENLAPHSSVLGVMLPYAPIHYLLLEEQDLFVMTSGNPSGEPLYYEPQAALHGLNKIADSFLLHNRPIARPVEDSVLRVQDKEVQFIRRSRGYVPEALPFLEGPVLLACGGDLKNVFCLTKGSEAVLSGHMGDLATLRGYEHFAENVAVLQKLLQVQAEVIVHDLHPLYGTTRYALNQNLPKLAVQHHHAHAAAVLAEHGLFDEEALALVFDGTGYGPDGTIWGGEFLIASCRDYKRIGYLKYRPLPGSDLAVREPWRQSLAFLAQHYPHYEELSLPVIDTFPPSARLLLQSLELGLTGVETSSTGRLFDLASSLLGLCQSVTFEGQAAVLLEEAAKKGQGLILPYEVQQDGKGLYVLNFDQTLLELVQLMSQAKDSIFQAQAEGAASFQTTFCYGVCDLALKVAQQFKQNKIVLSGGVFQNQAITQQIKGILTKHGFTVLTNRHIPCNDGGLSFGQAAVARRSNLCV